MAKAN